MRFGAPAVAGVFRCLPDHLPGQYTRYMYNDEKGRLHCLDEFEPSDNTAMFDPQHQHNSTAASELAR